MNDRILKNEMVNWKELKLLQPSELKKMSGSQLSKMKESFKNNGFKSPFFVWENKKDIWCLYGHTRIPILKMLEEEGEVIPPMLPATFIDCKDKKEAKKAILIYNSHYADIEPDILADFIADLNIDELLNEINIKELNLTDDFDEDEKPEQDYNDLMYYIIKVNCTNEEELRETYENLTEQGYKCDIIM